MKMRSIVQNKNMLIETIDSNRGLVNVFTGIIATAEQTQDLLDAREFGQRDYLQYVSHHILQTPSVANPPVRKRRLLTMAPTKLKKKRMSSKEKEDKDVNKYIRKRLAWSNQTGQIYDESVEQYSILPRALSDTDGNPHKGNKSSWTEKLKNRYNLPESTPFISGLEYVPNIIIIDAMFAININPLRQHKSIEEYAHLLLRQYAFPHYTSGTKEVHLLFDNPERLTFNPKKCEHNRRYTQETKHHVHISFTQTSPIPRPWREYLLCRTCKRSIVEVLGLVFLRSANHVPIGKNLIIAGCFSGDGQDEAWIITGGVAIPQRLTPFNSNAMEADMRVWRHATMTQYDHIVIYSPDTDVYNIGLIIPACRSKHIVVQINLPQNPPKYVDMQKLHVCLNHDPDLASLPQSNLGSIMLQLYIVTGCDYLSYFSGIGKPTFLNIFYQHAEFITGIHSVGCIDQCITNSGFLAFVRLIGTVYFKRNLATIVSKLEVETPHQLFNSIKQASDEEKHKEWYHTIKKVIHVVSEDQRPPTLTALRRHWMRACWTHRMWSNSTKADQYDGLPPPETQGWFIDKDGYSIDWEAKEVTTIIQNTLDWLSKGCRCKTGCTSKRCACKKKGANCGAGCECKHCQNIQSSIPNIADEVGEEVDEVGEEVEDELEEKEADEVQEETDIEDLEIEIISDFGQDFYI